MNKNITSTYKSVDTEEWLDIHFNRPVGYAWALLFRQLGVHPNVVTLMSIVLGMAAGVLMYFPHMSHTLAAIVLLMWANHYDSADGQLARLTGKKTLWGRMLDGFAGDLWFFAIYAALCLRLTPQSLPFAQGHTWGVWIWLLAAYAGLVCHAEQCRLSDYYRNVHLFFLKGEAGSELDSSAQQRHTFGSLPWRGHFWWKAFLFFYARYTRSQERATPHFQGLLARVHAMQQAQDEALPTLRQEFLAGSRPLMKYTNILTFNTRAIVLCAAMLTGHPWLYFVFEISVLKGIYIYMHRRHEALCHRLETQYSATRR